MARPSREDPSRDLSFGDGPLVASASSIARPPASTMPTSWATEPVTWVASCVTRRRAARMRQAGVG